MGAVIASVKMPPERGSAAAFDVAHGLELGRSHARAEALPIGRTGLAEDVRNLEHVAADGIRGLASAG